MNKQAKLALFSLVISIISLVVAINAKADIYIKIGSGYKLIET